MWENLKNKITALVSNNNLIQQVYDYEAEEFSGEPAATIVASGNESDYRTSNYNRHVYAFRVQIWVKRGEPRSPREAEYVTQQVVDSIMADFTKYYTLGATSPGSALVLPTGYSMVRTSAIPVQWGYAQREALYRVAEILVQAHIDVDVNLINSN